MYNRYIPNGATYRRVVEEDAPPPPPRSHGAGPAAPTKREPDKASHLSDAQAHGIQAEASKVLSNVKAQLSALLKGLELGGLDTGDILILLILLLLFLDGDDTELLITLGLVLLLGLK